MAASVRTFVRSLSRKHVCFSAVLRRSDCRRFSGAAEDRSTHFGFETVSETEKASKVYKVFENVAQKYDVMNDAMSLGIHRLWKDALLHVMHPQPGARLLDVAGGTGEASSPAEHAAKPRQHLAPSHPPAGDIAFRFLEYVRSQQERQQRRAVSLGQTPSWRDISDTYPDGGGAPESAVVVCDINKEMLKVGRQRADSRGVTTGLSWVVGDAEELPFLDDQFDLYTIAFGIRNVTHIDQALKEALRVLKPGGRFLCLEFSKVTNPVLERLYDVYSFQGIPVLGEVIAGDWKSYQYLVESIRNFPDQETFKGLMEDSGFSCVQYFNLTGGVVALHSGFKL